MVPMLQNNIATNIIVNIPVFETSILKHSNKESEFVKIT